jgi:hypothetical protein
MCIRDRGTKEQAAWTLILERSEKEVEEQKRAIIIGKEIIKLCKKRIKEEQEIK